MVLQHEGEGVAARDFGHVRPARVLMATDEGTALAGPTKANGWRAQPWDGQSYR